MMKVVLLVYLVLLLCDDYYCWVINDINTKMIHRDVVDNVVEETRIPQLKINLIFPGTKWCGAGNVADNYDDLGDEWETDMCCREHDNCPNFILGGETKYGLQNDAFYTRVHCNCDDKFLSCLKAANTSVARLIGSFYFNGLRTKCYREDFPTTGCNKKGGWLQTKCVEHSYDTSMAKVYQWFDVQDF